MKTIIAEKPSVAREIARIVGATERKEGYLTGSGYNVTWVLGHLISPTLPEAYGISRFNREDLPILPPVFLLVPRQERTAKGYKPDSGVLAQIKIITHLFKESEKIIVATDAGQEGELIFRYLYEYIGCSISFDRLWINSLTDATIRKGLKHLKCGAEYDHLYYAAKARSEADWLVGINATQVVTIAAGRGTYSLGRVQTPTLSMVCSRYYENKEFKSEPFWQIYLSSDTNNDDKMLKLTSTEKWKNKITAEDIYNKVKQCKSAIISKVECKRINEEPPLLYDLTTLQKEANSKYGFSADKTLSIAQKLYEVKLITYPRTGSRYIPEDVYNEIPSLLKTISEYPFALPAKKITLPNRRSVDNKKVTDHHALLITGIKAENIGKDDRTILNIITGRMIEAFSKDCIKELTTVTAKCGETDFSVKGAVLREKGWRGIYNEKGEDRALHIWHEKQELEIKGYSITEGRTKPEPLHTEATLLAAMETAGRDIKDESLREAVKDCGIGTPATRAAIIEALLFRDYMVRDKKTLVPTEKGLAIYSIVKQMSIASTTITGEWEQKLANIEQGKLCIEDFRKGIEEYTRQITIELLTSDKLFSHKSSDIICPKCGKGHMVLFGQVACCNNKECALPIFRTVAGRLLSDCEITELLTNKHTGLLKGFKSKQSKTFNAELAIDSNFNITFFLPKKK